MVPPKSPTLAYRAGLPTRSKDGCLTCKAKHLKCDETRPACLRCSQKGIQCGGYWQGIRWSFKHQPNLDSSFSTFSASPTQKCARTPSSGARKPAERPKQLQQHQHQHQQQRPQPHPGSGSMADSTPSASSSTSRTSLSPPPPTNRPARDRDRDRRERRRVSNSEAARFVRDADALHSHRHRNSSGSLLLGNRSDSSDAGILSSRSMDSRFVVGQVPLPSPSNSNMVDKSSAFIINWFENVCPAWSGFDSTANPIRNIATDLWSNSITVRSSLESMSAAFMASRDPSMRQPALRLMKRATDYVQIELQIVKGQPMPSSIPTSLLFSLFGLGTTICWVDPRGLGLPFFREARQLLSRLNRQKQHERLERPEQESSRALDADRLVFFNKCMTYCTMLLAFVHDDFDDAHETTLECNKEGVSGGGGMGVLRDDLNDTELGPSVLGLGLSVDAMADSPTDCSSSGSASRQQQGPHQPHDDTARRSDEEPIHPWTGVSSRTSLLFAKTVRLCRRFRQSSQQTAVAVAGGMSFGMGMGPFFPPVPSIEDIEAERLEELLLDMEISPDGDVSLGSSAGIQQEKRAPASSSSTSPESSSGPSSPAPSTTTTSGNAETGDQTTPASHLALVAEAYRLASLLLLYQTFPNLVFLRLPGRVQPADDETVLWREWITPLSLHLVRVLEQIPPTSGSRVIQPLLYISASTGLRMPQLRLMPPHPITPTHSHTSTSTAPPTSRSPQQMMETGVLPSVHGVLGSLGLEAPSESLDVPSATLGSSLEAQHAAHNMMHHLNHHMHLHPGGPDPLPSIDSLNGLDGMGSLDRLNSGIGGFGSGLTGHDDSLGSETFGSLGHSSFSSGSLGSLGSLGSFGGSLGGFNGFGGPGGFGGLGGFGGPSLSPDNLSTYVSGFMGPENHDIFSPASPTSDMALPDLALDVSRARLFIRQRMNILESSLPPTPVTVAKDLVAAIWRAYDANPLGTMPVHWIDVMEANNLRSMFG